jgi:hypothetical protein
MKKLITTLFFLISILTFGQTKQEVKSKILKLRKQGDNKMRLFNDGTYCENYFSEWNKFNFKDIRTYLPQKSSAEANSIVNEIKKDIKFLKDLKENYLRPNGAYSTYQTDYRNLIQLKEKIRQLEKSIKEYPYPLVWGKRAACVNVIDRINGKIRDYSNKVENLQRLSEELETNNNSSTPEEENINTTSNNYEPTNKNNSTSNSNNSSNKQAENNNVSNSSNRETSAEKLKRLDRERGEQIMHETKDNIARVKSNSEILGESINQISKGIVSVIQEKNRRKELENQKKEKKYQKAVSKRDDDIAKIAKKQNLVTDEKMASLKTAEFANWDSNKLSKNINNLKKLIHLNLRNYRSNNLP